MNTVTEVELTASDASFLRMYLGCNLEQKDVLRGIALAFQEDRRNAKCPVLRLVQGGAR